MNERDHQVVEKRAYFIWKGTGRQDSLANWSQAEREFFQGKHLRALQTFEVVPAMFLPNGKNKSNTA